MRKSNERLRRLEFDDIMRRERANHRLGAGSPVGVKITGPGRKIDWGLVLGAVIVLTPPVVIGWSIYLTR